MKDGYCFNCKKKGHFVAKCPKNTSSKLKKCMEMDEFVDNWSVVDSEDECSNVYILSETEDTVEEEGLDTSQKMNIYIGLDCEIESESETISEYSQIDFSEIDDISEESDEEEKDAELATIKGQGKISDIYSKAPSFCPVPKNIGYTTNIDFSQQYDLEVETNLMKKIVRENDLLYIIVEIQLGKGWVEVDAFIDSGGSNNLARPHFFKSSWKPLRNIINSKTIGGNVTLTHYVDNIHLKIGGALSKSH